MSPDAQLGGPHYHSLHLNHWQDHLDPFLLLRMHPNDLFFETCHLIVLKACQNLCQISVSNMFLKFQICTQTLAPPETSFMEQD